MFKLILSLCILLTLFSCDLPEGEGGNNTIRGHVFMKKYNSDFSRLIQEYYLADERVYIIYGDDTTTYHDDVRTNFDGSFEFRYLRSGKYTVFAYSRDSLSITGLPKYAVKKSITLKDDDEKVFVEDIIVLDN
jgi:hypothetical protein